MSSLSPPHARSPPRTGWDAGIHSTPHLPAVLRIQPRALPGASNSGETSTRSPSALWTRGGGAPGPPWRPAVQSVPAGQRLHLGTHGSSPPPPARRRRFLPGGIRESWAPQAPASRAAEGWSKGGEFGKLVNTQAPPPLPPSPAAAPSRRPQPAPRSWRQRPGGVRGGCAPKNLKDARGCTLARQFRRLPRRSARPLAPCWRSQVLIPRPRALPG